MNTSPPSHRILDRYFGFLQRRKLSDFVLFHIALILCVGSGLAALIHYNNTHLTTVPTAGGTLVEGIVGTPRFINPVLAITRADHDVSSLVYNGLMKIDHTGKLVNDIAETITLSEDGRTYNIKIRDGISFHDGTLLTARDVAFTIALIQNPDLKSPLQGNWDGIIVEELSDRELNIILPEAHTPFEENFTLGILPREIWDELPIEQLPFSQHNTEPIGSGPYKITDVLRNKSGLINAYKLKAFNDGDQSPNINTLVFNFYQNEEALLSALEDGEIASTPSLSFEQIENVDTDKYQIIETTLPRTFAIYFNQNKSTALRDLSARQALDQSLNKEALVEHALNGHGVSTDTPIPASFLALQSASTTTSAESTRPETILLEGGWRKNADNFWEKEIDEETVTLRVVLSTANTPLFEATANFVAESWRALGVDVQVDQYEQADLVQGIIRPRDFQGLLFGAELGRATDLYPFWHSSQKDDPGINIAQYTNITADGLLEKLRAPVSAAEKAELTDELITELNADQPAVFLFAPNFTYVIDKDVEITPFTKLGTPSERFANVSDWHITASKLWPIFSKQ